jgi:hypothetical protein
MTQFYITSKPSALVTTGTDATIAGNLTIDNDLVVDGALTASSMTSPRIPARSSTAAISWFPRFTSTDDL